MPADTDLAARARQPLTRLPSFDLDGEGLPGEDAIEAYERDGVVCLHRVFGTD